MKFTNKKTKILSFLPALLRPPETLYLLRAGKALQAGLPQIIAMLFLVGFIAYAWTEPSSVPPGGNVPTPINVGSASQYKSGAFGLGGLFHAFSDAIFDGKVSVDNVTIKGDGSVSANLNADKIDGYNETDILILGKKVCKQYTGGPKVCYPLVNKIANTYYYIDGTAINSMPEGISYDSCAPNFTTYRHTRGLSYYLQSNCTGDEYSNTYEGWHGYCINEINDPNLKSQECNLPDSPECIDDGNCWYGRDPFPGGTTGEPACVISIGGGVTYKSFKDRRGGGAEVCKNLTGPLYYFYKFVRTPDNYTCCTIEQ